jgi:uncharacterized membrane protein YqgA involved in biofilm formation
VITILKFAVGAIVLCWLLFGERYGSSGATIIELAKTVAGTKAKTCQSELSTKAVAIVVLRVVNAVGIIPPLS